MQKQAPRLPSSADRITILGSTGSGKTIAGLWHLSNANFLDVPWIVFDYKRDENIGAIKRAEHIEVGQIPNRAGIYIVNPTPSQKEEVTEYLYKIWNHENVGIWIDEGFMMGDDEALGAILTQGRSKQIPAIILSQRPSWISRFAFSEAGFFQVFRLTDERDKKTVKSFIPGYSPNRIPDFHSQYYDVGRGSLYTFSPVPGAKETLAKIHERLSARKRFI